MKFPYSLKLVSLEWGLVSTTPECRSYVSRVFCLRSSGSNTLFGELLRFCLTIGLPSSKHLPLGFPSCTSSFGLPLMSLISGRRGFTVFFVVISGIVSECWPSFPPSFKYVVEFHIQRGRHTGTSVYLPFPLQLSIFKGSVCIPRLGWRGPSPCWRDGPPSVSDVSGGLPDQGVVGSFIPVFCPLDQYP